MGNRIRDTSVVVRRLSAVEAEVDVLVNVEAPTPATELRGRLMGPRCPGVTTVELAYPFRPVQGAAAPTFRVVIPEPNLWTPETPFVYEGTVELWEDGRCCDRAPISIGLKLR
jgi:hypothetical protein